MSDPAINHETGEVTQGRSPRFTSWVALMVFSAITLGSAVEVKNDLTEVTSEAKWVVACSAVTVFISVVVVACHMFPFTSPLIVGTRFEGILCIFLAAFWSAEVAIATNANNGLGATNDSQNQVLNGNLYYFSWAGFVTSIILLVSYIRSAFGLDVVGEFKERSARLTGWAALLACSMVVLGSSVRVKNTECGTDGNGSETFCRRTNYAISIGAIGIFFSIVVVVVSVWKTVMPFTAEFIFIVILTALNAFGVAFITSFKGPGTAIGNLYYFSWGSFLVSCFLGASCFNQYTGRNTADSGDKDGDGDIEVENMDDQI